VYQIELAVYYECTHHLFTIRTIQHLFLEMVRKDERQLQSNRACVPGDVEQL